MHPEPSAQTELDSPVGPPTKLREKVERGASIGGRREAARHATSTPTSTRTASRRWKTVAKLQDARNGRADVISRVERGERPNVTLGAFADAWLERQESRLRPTTHSL